MCLRLFVVMLLGAIPFSMVAQEALVIDSSYAYLDVYLYMEAVAVEGDFRTPDQLPADLDWQAIREHNRQRTADSLWWFRGRVENRMEDSVDYILKGAGIGYVDVFLLDSAGHQVIHHWKTGLYYPASEKPMNRVSYSHVPIRFGPGTHLVLIRAQSIDHQDFVSNWNLESPASWYARPAHRLDLQLQFFQGVFWILIIYNLVLFFSLRIPAYLYYAGYLLSVSLFVMFAVGDMTHPAFGHPRWLAPIGYLAFGSINIFYYLFGRNFLNLTGLLPKWDRFIRIYILVKLAILVLVQVNLYTYFHIPLALAVEFSMILLDVLISLVFFVALLKTRSQLAYFFVAGSASVVVFGISAAISGYLFNFTHTFSMFLGSIVVEVIFFSLGLGYKIRLSEKQKLAAERDKRKAQEALNEELSRINTAFGRFVPQDFLRSLGHESILDVNLGDSIEKEVTVMFSDIRGYTTLSENMTPKENFRFLNDYLGRMGPIIHRHRGFVNQYYGDGIMALFLTAPEDAVQAAIGMQQELSRFNRERQAQGQAPIMTGIGIHTGPLMMGVIGDTLRLEAGVVADTVNIAARVEGLSKYFGATVLMSGSTAAGNGADIHQRYLGKVRVKGKTSGIEIFEVLDALPPDQLPSRLDSLDDFHQAVAHFQAGEFQQSIETLKALMTQYPADPAAEKLMNRAMAMQAHPPTEWDGVETMTEK